MRTRVSVLTLAVTVLAALALLVPGAALAAMTLAGTTVSNDATVDYKVGAVSQTQLLSNTVSFTVDAKVDFAITDAGGAWNTVTPGGAADTYYLTYQVSNNGNVGLDLDLNAFQVSNLIDDFDQTLHASTFYVDANGDSLYDGGDTLVTFVDELEVGLSNTIFVVAAVINSPQSDGEIAQIILNATAYCNGAAGGNAGDGGACTGIVVADADGDDNGCDGMDWELADDGNSGDGIEGIAAAFVGSSADLTVTKTSSLVWDPVNGSTDPIAIPGARISFTVEVANAAAGATATDIVITDQLPSTLGFNSATITLTNTGGGAGSWSLTNAAGGCPEFGDACGWYDGTDTVVVKCITLDASDTATIIFTSNIK